MMNGITKASAVVIVGSCRITVRPNAVSVAAGMADARVTPAEVGQVIAVVRTVQTNQLLVMRSPFVTLEAPFVGVRPKPGVNA